MDNLLIVYGSGWRVYTYPSEQYDFVNWDDDNFPTVSGKIIRSCSSHHKPDSYATNSHGEPF